MSNDREALMRYARAKRGVEDRFVNPITELIQATTDLVAEIRIEARQSSVTKVLMEELWAELGATNQPEALEAIKRLRDR